MTIVVLGSRGQVASHLRRLLPDAKYCGREVLDLADPARAAATIEAARPSAIVNAAGYTAVDRAESEPDAAWRVNTEGAAAAARVAAALDIPFVQLSTDYVFDGRKTSEYVEDDPANPQSVYGATKLAAEIAVRVLCRKAWIVRASWIFSEYGANFVRTILQLAATSDELAVVGDQYGRPTYAGDLATVIAAILHRRHTEDRLPFGTYHAVGGPIVSRCQFADAIVAQAFERGVIAKRVAVRPITTPEYPTPARRPANSALRPSAALERAVGMKMDWRTGLAATLTAPGA